MILLGETILGQWICPDRSLLEFDIYEFSNQADKLFDEFEIIVNNEKISSRNNSNEYFLASFLQVKSNHPADHYSDVSRPKGC